MFSTEYYQSVQEARRSIAIRFELFAFCALMLLVLALRLDNLDYNTIFVDEAFYVLIGEDAWAGRDQVNATTWVLGSYLYPFVAYASHEAGGLTGLRITSAVLSAIAALFVYLTAHRLFGPWGALAALLIFGITNGSISIGQFGTYDALGIPLLAISLYCLVNAAFSERRTRLWLIGSGVALAVSFLAKYIALLFVPVVFAIGLGLFIWRRKPLWSLFFVFLPAAGLIIVPYGLYFFNDLRTALQTQVSSTPLDRWVVVRVTLENIGFAVIIAALGIPFLIDDIYAQTKGGNIRRLALIAIGVILVFLATLAVPIYHIVSAASTNIRAVEKHSIYALVLIAPLAGYTAMKGANWIFSYRGEHALWYRSAAALITSLVLIWFFNYSLDMNWGFQHSWPNISGAVQYLRDQGLNSKSYVLASGSSMYEYYFDFGVDDRNVWNSTWYFNYKGQVGDVSHPQAMKQAIADRALDFVVLDDYYTPTINQQLEPALARAGYRLGFIESERLSYGEEVRVRVFVPDDAANP